MPQSPPLFRVARARPPGLFRMAPAGGLLAAGVGCFALSLLALVAGKSEHVKRALIFYKPTGPLSGVAILTVFIWLLSWAILEWRWKRRELALIRVSITAFLLLALTLLLTVPPIINGL